MYVANLYHRLPTILKCQGSRMGMLRRVQRRKQFGVVVAGSYCCADVGTVRPDVTYLVCSAVQLPLHLPISEQIPNLCRLV